MQEIAIWRDGLAHFAFNWPGPGPIHIKRKALQQVPNAIELWLNQMLQCVSSRIRLNIYKEELIGDKRLHER